MKNEMFSYTSVNFDIETYQTADVPIGGQGIAMSHIHPTLHFEHMTHHILSNSV